MNNGLLDFAVTDFSDEAKLLFHNDGGGELQRGFNARRDRQDFDSVSCDGEDGFLDYDNDGWLDLMLINGHIYPASRPCGLGNVVQRSGRCCFTISATASLKRARVVKGSGRTGFAISGRGAAFGDLFNDGKIDVVIISSGRSGDPVAECDPDHHHWVELKLVGGGKGPRDAVGATVYLTADGMRQRQDVMSGGVYFQATISDRTSDWARLRMREQRRFIGHPAQRKR